MLSEKFATATKLKVINKKYSGAVNRYSLYLKIVSAAGVTTWNGLEMDSIIGTATAFKEMKQEFWSYKHKGIQVWMTGDIGKGYCKYIYV